MAAPSRQQNAVSVHSQEEAPVHVVGPGTTHTGEMIHPGPVEVWGTITRGRLIATSVSVKPGGVIDGDVKANKIRNNGKIIGTIVTPLLEMSGTSETGGRIQIENFAAERGAKIREKSEWSSLAEGTLPRLNAEDLAQEAEAKSRAMRSGASVVRMPAPSKQPAPAQAPYSPPAAPLVPSMPIERAIAAPVEDDGPRPFLVG